MKPREHVSKTPARANWVLSLMEIRRRIGILALTYMELGGSEDVLNKIRARAHDGRHRIFYNSLDHLGCLETQLKKEFGISDAALKLLLE